jgi:ADP-ribose pyrophosphatase YjhB (NUDIX family)
VTDLKLLKKMIHKDVKTIEGNIFERRAARGIVLKGSKVLLLYTERYNDYSFPGGGVDLQEDLITGLERELAEETGAKNIEILSEFGYIDEYRPHYKPEFDLIHMLSYFFVCKVDDEFDAVSMEDYEVANGMTPVWINIYEAIAHNKEVIENQEESMGFSIGRETFVLEQVAEKLL